MLTLNKSAFRSLALAVQVVMALAATAQVGPRSPASASNNTGIGSNAWTTPTNVLASDNAYATVASRGITNYLVGSNFGFGIASPANIVGIQAEVEKSTSEPFAVSVLNAWSTGLSKTISAGTNRCLVVTHAQENGVNSRDITAMTYGGRSMTQVAERAAGIPNGYTARLEVWILLEGDIALAANTTIVPTYGPSTILDYCEVFSAAVYANVDQLAPVTSFQAGGAQSNTNPHQLTSPFATLAGGMAVQLVTAGNRDATNPPMNSNANSYPVPTGYTEVIDYYFANPGLQDSWGASLQVINKAISVAGSEAPACTFNGILNRWAIIGFHLQMAREFDMAVSLVKGGTVSGSNLASPAAWGTTDVYTVYGGPTNLWGQSWTLADVNAANFGLAFSARVQNGTARVDHMRITIYSMSTLPVELIDLRAVPEGDAVRLDWATATELNNDRFVVQRSANGLQFADVGVVDGAGTTTVTSFYAWRDEDPLPGTSYYRLVQVDLDGTTDPSPVVAVTFTPSQALVVFPNPTTDGVITIHDAPGTDREVMVYDSSMRLVRSARLADGDPVLHLGDLPDGTYFILVQRDGTFNTTRVMKASRSL